jgi:hypothetical protein
LPRQIALLFFHYRHSTYSFCLSFFHGDILKIIIKIKRRKLVKNLMYCSMNCLNYNIDLKKKEKYIFTYFVLLLLT